MGGLATDLLLVKRDGRVAKAILTCAGTHHEEVETQEGQVGRRNFNRIQRRGPISKRLKALKTIKDARSRHPR